jgi:hypothetical protein
VIRPVLDQFGRCAHPGERPVGRPVRQGQSVSVRHQPGPRLTTVGTCHRQYHARRGHIGNHVQCGDDGFRRRAVISVGCGQRRIIVVLELALVVANPSIFGRRCRSSQAAHRSVSLFGVVGRQKNRRLFPKAWRLCSWLPEWRSKGKTSSALPPKHRYGLAALFPGQLKLSHPASSKKARVKLLEAGLEHFVEMLAS